MLIKLVEGFTTYPKLWRTIIPHSFASFKNMKNYTRIGNVCPGWPVYGVKCLCSTVGMKEGGEPLPLAVQYLILMIWKPCDLDRLSSLAAKCQNIEIRGLQFYIIKWLKNRHFNLKVLTKWSQQRYHNQIQIIMFSYHKNQILKC